MPKHTPILALSPGHQRVSDLIYRPNIYPTSDISRDRFAVIGPNNEIPEEMNSDESVTDWQWERDLHTPEKNPQRTDITTAPEASTTETERQ